MTRKPIWVALTLALSAPAYAQQDGFRVGEFTVYPTLGISLAWDDNINAGAETNKESSLLTVISPGVQIHTGTERSSLRLQLSAEFGDYEATDLDDYEDYRAALSWDYAPTVRTRVGANLSLGQSHNRRGDGLRRFDDGTPEREVDVYQQLAYALRFNYGAPGARGRLGAELGYRELEYQNNRDLTAVADSETDYLNLEFGLRMAPKTTGLFLARFAETTFDAGERDHDSTFYGVGLDWDATARTSGRVEAGRDERDYKLTNEHYSGLGWSARIDWRWRDYSIFAFGGGRDTSDGFGESLFLVRDYYEVSWRHQWRPRLGSTLEVTQSEDSLRPGDREDETFAFGASLNYQFRPWAVFGLGYQYFDRDSTDPNYIYDRNTLILSVELSP